MSRRTIRKGVIRPSRACDRPDRTQASANEFTAIVGDDPLLFLERVLLAVARATRRHGHRGETGASKIHDLVDLDRGDNDAPLSLPDKRH
jgi:hypothetical protein